MRPNGKSKRTTALILAAVAMAAAAASYYFIRSAGAPGIDLDPYAGVGTVTAEETVKLLQGKGQILVIFRDTGADKNPVIEAQLKALRRTLTKHPGVNVASEGIGVAPMMMMATGGGVPADLFLKALQSHPNTSAVILFFGFPQLSEPELDALKKSDVKVVAVSSFRPGYKQLFEREVLHLAVVPRPDAQPGSSEPARTVRERFAQQYTLVTPAEAARWP